MNRPTKAQKDKIVQFRNITGANDKVAGECLLKSAWVVENAIDYYYANGFSAAAPSNDRSKIDALFKKYKEPDSDIIGVDGITKLCDDLGVDASDVVMLVLSYHMHAATMCEYTAAEWADGLSKLGVESVAALRRKVPAMRAELADPDTFKEIYNFAFGWATEKNQKVLACETAVAMWQLLFAEDRWPLVDDWCEYVTKNHNRAVLKDTWMQLLQFTRQIKPDFSNFDENGAWPYLLDDFVDYMKKKRGEQ